MCPMSTVEGQHLTAPFQIRYSSMTITRVASAPASDQTSGWMSGHACTAACSCGHTCPRPSSPVVGNTLTWSLPCFGQRRHLLPEEAQEELLDVRGQFLPLPVPRHGPGPEGRAD